MRVGLHGSHECDCEVFGAVLSLEALRNAIKPQAPANMHFCSCRSEDLGTVFQGSGLKMCLCT